VADEAEDAGDSPEHRSADGGTRKAKPEAEAEGETVEPEKPLGKPRDDPRARMLEATRKEAEAKREAQRERQRAEAAERRIQEIERAKVEAENPTLKAEPQLSEYDDFEKYLADRDKFRRQEWERETAEKQREYQAREAAARTVGFIDKSLQEFRKRQDEAGGGDRSAFLARLAPEVLELQPSFTVDDPREIAQGHIVADEIIRSERGPALMLHFTDHPDELQRVLALRTKEDIRVEVRLIAKGLTAATSGNSAKPRVSQAPPPVRPVTGVPHTASDDPDPESDDYDTWSRKVDAKERRRR
jgi:hypothetical protein